jgi:hypothetical protein
MKVVENYRIANSVLLISGIFSSKEATELARTGPKFT